MPTRIRSAKRAIDVLELVAAVPSGRTATEIATALKIPVATAHHLVNTLVESGALSKHERRYLLGPKIAVLGEALYRSNYVPMNLLPILDALAADTHETVYLSAWRRGDAVVLAVVGGRHAVNVAGPPVGFSAFTHARAAGKVLMASLDPDAFELYLATHSLDPVTPNAIVDEDVLRRELSAVRERGYALDEEEFKEGVSCIAAPVKAGGFAFAALTLSAPADRFRERVQAYTEAVVAAAKSAGFDGTSAAGDADDRVATSAR